MLAAMFVLVWAFAAPALGAAAAGDSSEAASQPSRSSEFPNPFEEVPGRTWPYAVIDHFHRRGWVEGYPYGLYAAGRSLTRYELGLITTRILEHVGAQGTHVLSPREVQWLQMLVREYQAELELLGYHQEEVQPSSSAAVKDVTVSPAGRLERPGMLPLASGLEGTVGTATVSPALLRAARLGWGGDWLSWEPGLADVSGGRGVAGETLASRGGEQAGDAPVKGGEFALAVPPYEWEPAGYGPGFGDTDGEPSRRLFSVSGGPDILRADWPDAALSEGEPLASFADGQGSEGSFVRIGARASLGVVDRGDDDPWGGMGLALGPDADDRRGYDLVLELGDLRITSSEGGLRGVLERAGGPSSGAGWRVRVADPSVMRAAAVGDPRERQQLEELPYLSPRAALDVDLLLPQGRLRIGWQYEGEGSRASLSPSTIASAGVEYRLDDRAQALAGFALEGKEEGTTRTAELGLRYALGRDSSLLLGYRLIDFSRLTADEQEKVRENLATAEFSIRF